MSYHHRDADFWRKYELPEPEAAPHGTEEEILSNMKQLVPNSWKLEGNKLVGKTEMGTLVQYIPTDYILEGSTSDGLPKFKRIVL